MPTMLEHLLAPRPFAERVKDGRSVSTKVTHDRYETLMEATRVFKVRKSELLAGIFDHGFRHLEAQLATARRRDIES